MSLSFNAGYDGVNFRGDLMNRIIAVLLVVLLGMTTGCQKMYSLVLPDHDQDIVFVPGYKVNLGGEEAVIFGFSQCSTYSDMSSKYEPSRTEMELPNSCIRMTPKDTSVDVLVVTGGERLRETWTVNRFNEYPLRFSLRRPNGSLVAVARN